MKQVGKIGRLNQKANREIKKAFIEHDIWFCETCEVLHGLGRLKEPCMQAGTNAHRNGRIWYRGRGHLLWDFTQFIKSCVHAHRIIDNDYELREKVFMILRGEAKTQ